MKNELQAVCGNFHYFIMELEIPTDQRKKMMRLGMKMKIDKQPIKSVWKNRSKFDSCSEWSKHSVRNNQIQ